MTKCDICNKETDNLVDFYVMLCPKCRIKHSDMILLKRLGLEIEKNISLQKRMSEGQDAHRRACFGYALGRR